MSDVKRWEIETPKVGGRSHLLGPDTTHSEAFTYITVREDRATETERSRVLEKLANWARDDFGERPTLRKCGQRRDELLSLVFGEEASRG